MKALSIRQPWAFLIVAASGYDNPKRVENRNWAPRYTGPLLVHAARTVDFEGARKTVMRRPDLVGIEDPKRWEQEGLRGGIVGVTWLSRVMVPTSDEWFDHRARYGWILRAAYPLPFAPMLGLPGLFEVPETTLPEETRLALDVWLSKQKATH